MRLLISFGILLAATVAAAASCFEPSPPYCAERFGSFDDGYDFERCKREMENYQSEVESHIQCIQEEAEDQTEDAISAYNEAVEGFNRRARGY